MARKSNVFPSYLLHKPTGQARVRIDGKDRYLGEYGSDESRIEYGKLIANLGSNLPIDPIADSKRGSLPRNESDDPGPSVGELCLVFLRHAETHYVKNGKQTSEVCILKSVISPLNQLYGIHAIFGAFLLGVVIPHDGQLARSFRHKLEDVVSILLLPIFFAYTGTRTQIGLLSEFSDWGFCFLIILVATLGKFGGTLIASKFAGLDWRTSASLGILMNTRGLMELIVLNIGLDLGVISPTLFAMMVLMALVTTIATTPVLRLLVPPEDAASAVN